MLDKEFHTSVVDEDCANNGERIAAQLAATAIFGCLEGDVAIEPKANKECYREDDNKRGDMW